MKLAAKESPPFSKAAILASISASAVPNSPSENNDQGTPIRRIQAELASSVSTTCLRTLAEQSVAAVHQLLHLPIARRDQAQHAEVDLCPRDREAIGADLQPSKRFFAFAGFGHVPTRCPQPPRIGSHPRDIPLDRIGLLLAERQHLIEHLEAVGEIVPADGVSQADERPALCIDVTVAAGLRRELCIGFPGPGIMSHGLDGATSFQKLDFRWNPGGVGQVGGQRGGLVENRQRVAPGEAAVRDAQGGAQIVERPRPIAGQGEMLREPGGHLVALVRRIDLLQPLADGAVQLRATHLPDPLVQNLPIDRVTECIGADKLLAWEELSSSSRRIVQEGKLSQTASNDCSSISAARAAVAESK